MDSLEGRIVGDDKLWDYLIATFKVRGVSKIKKDGIPDIVKQNILELQTFDNVSEGKWIKKIKKYRNDILKEKKKQPKEQVDTLEP